MARFTRALATTGVAGLMLALAAVPAAASPAPSAVEIAAARAEQGAVEERRTQTGADLAAAREQVQVTARTLAAATEAARVASRVRPVVVEEAERAEQKVRTLQQPRRVAAVVGPPPAPAELQAARTWADGSKAAVRAADEAILAARLEENAAQMAHARAQTSLQQATHAAEQAAVAHAAATEHLQAQLAAVDPAAGRLARPATGEVTSPFGPRRHPLTGGTHHHNGVDFAAGDGTAYAAASGTVLSAGWNGSYGLEVVVDHGGGLTTRYAHLASTAVAPGQQVTVGDSLGAIGSTGASTGPHLHFEVLAGDGQVDPAGWVG